MKIVRIAAALTAGAVIGLALASAASADDITHDVSPKPITHDVAPPPAITHDV